MCKFAIFFFFLFIYLFRVIFFSFFVCFTCNNNKKKLMTYSVTTLQECGHLTVAAHCYIFRLKWQKLLFHLLRKMGYDGQFIGDLKLGSQLFHPLFRPYLLVASSDTSAVTGTQAHGWESLFRKRNMISCQRQKQNSLKSPWNGQNC